MIKELGMRKTFTHRLNIHNNWEHIWVTSTSRNMRKKSSRRYLNFRKKAISWKNHLKKKSSLILIWILSNLVCSHSKNTSINRVKKFFLFTKQIIMTQSQENNKKTLTLFIKITNMNKITFLKQASPMATIID